MPTAARSTTDEDRGFVRSNLKELLTGYLRRWYPFATTGDGELHAGVAHADAWRDLSATGVPSLGLSETQGGDGLGDAELGIAFEASARSLYPGPLFAATALARPAIEHDRARLDAFLAGTLVPTLAWAEHDAAQLRDRTGIACTASRDGDGWVLDGDKRGVLAMDLATDVVVLARAGDEEGLWLVAAGASGVTVDREEPFDGTRPSWSIGLHKAPAVRIADAADAAAALARARVAAYLAAAAEALGVGGHVLDVACQYARDRHAFGKPIGAYQAIAHRLADVFSELTLARETLGWAQAASAPEQAELAATAAKLAATRAGRSAVEAAIHVHGAIACTWELPLHHFYRRAVWLEQFDGGPVEHERELGDRVADARGAELPVATESADDDQLADQRREVRAWIARSLPAGHDTTALETDEAFEVALEAWRRTILSSGRATSHWPTEHGGSGLEPEATAMFLEEAMRAFPRGELDHQGQMFTAPLLFASGEQEQLRRYLDPIRTGEELWALGLSEPDHGSDLAALRTRAVRDGEEYVVNGDKIWVSYGHVADRMTLLCRTDPDAPRHRGLTYLLVDLRLPGVEIEPLHGLRGRPYFAHVRFRDARVPVACRLGPENGGWSIALAQLRQERAYLTIELTALTEFSLDRLRELFATADERRAGDETLRRRLGLLWVRLQALKLFNRRVLRDGGDDPALDAASQIAKVVWAELEQDVNDVAVQLLGPGFAGAQDPARRTWYWRWKLLESRGATIQAGTNDIVRSVVAEHALDLPRSR